MTHDEQATQAAQVMCEALAPRLRVQATPADLGRSIAILLRQGKTRDELAKATGKSKRTLRRWVKAHHDATKV